MCGRFTLIAPARALESLFNVLNLMDYPPRFNIAPTQPILTIENESRNRTARLMRWGLVPGWVKDPRDFPLLVNARSETLTEKPAFRDAVKHHRCVIPASGYYEWQRGGPEKTPYYISRSDGEPMAMAGLWSTWTGPDGEEIDTATVVTVPANGQIGRVHDRMPAILDGDSVEAWLDVRNVRAEEAMTHIRPLEEDLLTFHPVSRRVNSATNDGPDLIAEVPAGKAQDSAKTMEVKQKNSAQLDLF